PVSILFPYTTLFRSLSRFATRSTVRLYRPKKADRFLRVTLSGYPMLSGVPSCQFTALLISLDGRPPDQIQPIVGEHECRARLFIGNFLADPFNVKDANA